MAPVVKEAVKRVQHGHGLSDLVGDTVWTAAGAIALCRLIVLEQTPIAKKVDSQEKDVKAKTITMRIFKIERFAQAGLKSGMHKVDAGSLADFLSSPMRANIPKIETPESAKKKREKAASPAASPSYTEYFKSMMAVP